jgi:hypothetical protein
VEQMTGRAARDRRFGRLLAPALIGIAALLAACGGDDDPSGAGSTTTASSARVTVDRSTAVWPTEDSDERPADAADAARTFAVEVLHFEDPVVGELRQGDSRSGEVDVRPTGDGPVTMLLVRQLSGEETWSVLGAVTDDIQIDSPSAGQAVGDPVVVRGRGRAFEGVIDVAVLADGDDEPIGSGTVMGGGDELRPFEGAIERASTDAERGALVLFTRSAKDGAVWSASVVRIGFAGAGLANPASVYCEEQGGTVEIEETDDGQRGVCALPDGTRVDEWELYRDRAR